MIGADPRYKCKVCVVRVPDRLFGKYCTREDAEKAITRLAPAYNIPLDRFTIIEELV